jgi:hypothetical protein
MIHAHITYFALHSSLLNLVNRQSVKQKVYNLKYYAEIVIARQCMSLFFVSKKFDSILYFAI